MATATMSLEDSVKYITKGIESDIAALIQAELQAKADEIVKSAAQKLAASVTARMQAFHSMEHGRIEVVLQINQGETK